MNILVTGGSGFIGSHVVDKLIEKGHKVRILDLKTPHLENVNHFKGSILDLNIIEEATCGVDIIYHFAGISNIDKVKDNPLQTIEHNILGTAKLLEVARIQKIKRFMLASSVYIFDRGGHFYTYSKKVSEEMCKYYQEMYFLPYTIMRLATAYGPRSRGEDVISIFVRNFMEGLPISVKGGGNQIRNFIYVKDLAEGCIKGLSEKCENQTVTIAGKEEIDISDLSLLIKTILKSEASINIESENDRYSDYDGGIENVNKSYEILQWKPEIILKEGIKKYIKWVKQYKE